MYIIPPFEAGVTLFYPNGTSRLFANRRLLLNALGLSCLRRAVGPRLDPSLNWRYVIRDENGTPLFARDFEHLAPHNALEFYGRYGRVNWNGEGPVPHTGRSHRYHVFRSAMRTAQERRLHAFVDVEAGEPPPRACRTGFNLPSNYSDFARSDYDTRSWKHYRKNQWKA